MRVLPLLFLGLLTAPAIGDLRKTEPVGSAWREDVRLIAELLPKRHPDLFYRMPRTTWDSAVRSLERRIPRMTRNQALVGLMELVALPHDGHTSLNPAFDPGFAWRYYPVQYEWFEDGLFIRKALPEQAALLGAKVVRIGKVPVDEALARAEPTLPHENEWFVRAHLPWRLAIPELLDGLGLVEDLEALPLVVERGGRQETVILRAAGRITPQGHNPGGGIDTRQWLDMRKAGGPPLWQRHPERPYWVEYISAQRLLYVAYRGVVDAPPPGNQEFWRSVFTLADSVPLERMVLDLRENGGGNSFFNRQVIRGILARPALDRPDRLYVLTSGRTFSAAMNLVLDLEQWTNATFVGAPTGNATVFFGDHTQHRLPRSGLTVNLSTLPWYPANPRDHRDFKAPQYYAPITSADYAAGRDPALSLVLDPALRPQVSERLSALVSRGDTAALLAEVTRLKDLPVNRFRTLEAELNNLGYARMREGKTAEALALFRVNTTVYGNSANTWDSLGEALAAAGQSQAAIRAYRQALAIDPDFGSAREALQRLGVPVESTAQH
jgi:hypothetical protein